MYVLQMPTRLYSEVAFVDNWIEYFFRSKPASTLTKKPSSEYSRIRLDIRLYHHNCFRTRIMCTLFFRVCLDVGEPSPTGNRFAYTYDCLTRKLANITSNAVRNGSEPRAGRYLYLPTPCFCS